MSNERLTYKGLFLIISSSIILSFFLIYFVYNLYLEATSRVVQAQKDKIELEKATKSIQDRDINIDFLTAKIQDFENDLDMYKLDIENKYMALEDQKRLLAEKETLLAQSQKEVDKLVEGNNISHIEAERITSKIDQLLYYVKKY